MRSRGGVDLLSRCLRSKKAGRGESSLVSSEHSSGTRSRCQLIKQDGRYSQVLLCHVGSIPFLRSLVSTPTVSQRFADSQLRQEVRRAVLERRHHLLYVVIVRQRALSDIQLSTSTLCPTPEHHLSSTRFTKSSEKHPCSTVSQTTLSYVLDFIQTALLIPSSLSSKAKTLPTPYKMLHTLTLDGSLPSTSVTDWVPPTWLSRMVRISL